MVVGYTGLGIEGLLVRDLPISIGAYERIRQSGGERSTNDNTKITMLSNRSTSLIRSLASRKVPSLGYSEASKRVVGAEPGMLSGAASRSRETHPADAGVLPPVR